MKETLQKHYRWYLMEALGLGIFMVSACFFTAMLEHPSTQWHKAIPDATVRLVCIAVAMGATAIVIFYSPVTAPSGAHINPAVTLVMLRMKQINAKDAFFYIIFQTIGGTVAVYIMILLMGHVLTDDPVKDVVTVPGKNISVWKAAWYEMAIAFVMITMMLNTSAHPVLKKYTRIFAGILVCGNVIIAGPVSGFGMNPARSLASAIPAHIYTAFWIYMLCPFIGMFAAAEWYVLLQKKKVA
ncbi:MAG: aquaporin [Bacteroidetes bacterium]|nr:aquaporin [Bacteroidota bacterium]